MKSARAIIIAAGFLLFAMSAFLLFEPGNDPTGFFVYTPSLAVLNQENNAGVGESLAIEFITKGARDLEITSSGGEVEFLGLKCGGEVIDLKPRKSINYQGYSCKENSKVIVKIVSKEAELNIKFGEDSQTAKNSAS
jgi:hypothetical protein